MKSAIVASLAQRLLTELAPQNPVNFLKKLNPTTIIDQSIPVLYLYTRSNRGNNHNILLTEVVCAIGHHVMAKNSIKKNSSLAAKAGAFILYTFEQAGILSIKLGAGKGRHATYIIDVHNDDAIVKLWEETPIDRIEKLPSKVPYADWTSTYHESGDRLIKTNNVEVLKSVKPDTHPIIFNCVNKAQQTGWQVNTFVYRVASWALRNKTRAFNDIWEQPDPESRQSKLRESKTVLNIAKRFIADTFYHLYSFDFRGRKYPTTAYFHEQGSDLSKGLLLRDEIAPITERGYYWLCVSIANNWAGICGREDGRKSDKIPLDARHEWVNDNIEIFLSYIKEPKVNQGWMEADKPWQFLAACNELNNLIQWQQQNIDRINKGEVGLFDYESGIEVFIDGSNNGSQHLAALTKDEVTAPHVNLVQSEYPGDIYAYVAESVWKRIEEEVNSLDIQERIACEQIIQELTKFKLDIKSLSVKSEQRRVLVDQLVLLRKANEKLIAKAAPVFWNKIVDLKDRRKIIKRNVMTLPL